MHTLSQYEWVGELMGNRFSSLKCKEVVNVCDGCRLGFVSDVEVDICNPRPGTPNSSKADDNFFFIPTDLS